MLTFFRQFVRAPTKIGAICASSEKLAELITEKADLSHTRYVVELGCGSGAFTEKIVNKINDDCTFFALDTNAFFVAQSQKKFPHIPIHHDSAQNLLKYLDKGQCETIICGLPWATFNKRTQLDILDSVHDALAPQGRFLTFAYVHGLSLPSGISFNRLLKEYFSHMGRTEVIWKNIPPAFVYDCMK